MMGPLQRARSRGQANLLHLTLCKLKNALQQFHHLQCFYHHFLRAPCDGHSSGAKILLKPPPGEENLKDDAKKARIPAYSYLHKFID